MRKNELFLDEQEVWPHMLVFISSFQKMPLANPPIFLCFETSQDEKRFFPWGGSMEGVEKFLLPQKREKSETLLSRVSFRGFSPDTRFSPVSKYQFPFNSNGLPLPPQTEFAVFYAGKALHYSGEYSNLPVIIWLTLGGNLFSVSPFAKKLYRQEFSLPQGAILVPISEILGFPSFLGGIR